MRRLPWFFPLVVVPVAFAAGEPTNTDVVTSAGDAFGITLGPETIGLYGPGSIRGFSPATAGNARIDGLYADLQGSMIDPLATETRIRVGLSATNFPWPAPSGIVDYTLREAHSTPGLTSIFYTGPYHTLDFDLNGSKRYLDDQFGIAAGIEYHSDEFNPGQTAHTLSWGILPQWHPNDRVSITTFLGLQRITDLKSQAIIYPISGLTLPPISPHYYGPSWINSINGVQHSGLLLKAELSTHWSLHFGVFQSRNYLPISYYDLYLNATSSGLADHDLVVAPAQHYGSSSGELQLTYTSRWDQWSEEILIGARGRSVKAQYGGADSFDLGVTSIEHPNFTLPFERAFGPTTSNLIHDYSFGTSYTLGWLDRIKFSVGLRRDTYLNEVLDPEFGSSATSLRPWLYNSSLVFVPAKDLELYAALTRGLEDSGVAPATAVNRGQVLPATHSSQEEAGVKYSPTPDLSLLGGIFNIQKSYFVLDQQGVFSDLGLERHRGLEFSLTGALNSSLHAIVGAVYMSPEVFAQSTPNEIIGKEPVGQTHWIGQVSVDYQFPQWPHFSVDGVLSIVGSRAASVDNRLVISGYRNLDLGARYHFTLYQHPATLRIQTPNLTNTLSWSIGGDGGLWRMSGRRASAYLIVDF